MKTECSANTVEFHHSKQREIIGKFDGGLISSDGEKCGLARTNGFEG